MLVYASIGISGSGKSHYYKILKHDINPSVQEINKDEIRKEITGNISDLDHEKDVAIVFHDELQHFTELNIPVYCSNTNLKAKYLTDIINTCMPLVKDNGLDLKLLIFKASEDPEACKERVKADLGKGRERSKTLEPVYKEGKNYPTVIDWQYDEFMSFIGEGRLDDYIEQMTKRYSNLTISKKYIED